MSNAYETKKDHPRWRVVLFKAWVVFTGLSAAYVWWEIIRGLLE